MPNPNGAETLKDLVHRQPWVRVWYNGGNLAAEGRVVAVNLDPTLWIQQADGTQTAVSATLTRCVYASEQADDANTPAVPHPLQPYGDLTFHRHEDGRVTIDGEPPDLVAVSAALLDRDTFGLVTTDTAGNLVVLGHLTYRPVRFDLDGRVVVCQRIHTAPPPVGSPPPCA